MSVDVLDQAGAASTQTQKARVKKAKTEALNSAAKSSKSGVGQGEVQGEFCDGSLQARAYRALKMSGATVTGREDESELNEQAGLRMRAEERRDVSRYIRQLEYAILQQQSGRLSSAEIINHLEKCVGFNLKPLSYSLETMFAEDA